MFIHKIWTGHEYYTFPASDLDRLTFGQGHYTPSVYQQSLCEVGFSIRKVWTGHNFAQTDVRTDRQGNSYIPPNFVFGGINIQFAYIIDTKTKKYHSHGKKTIVLLQKIYWHNKNKSRRRLIFILLSTFFPTEPYMVRKIKRLLYKTQIYAHSPWAWQILILAEY